MGNLVMVLKADSLATTTMESSVTKNDVTWTFDTTYPVGQFSNGDYFVIGPVTITRIEPDYANGGNGWEVNPLVQSDQGFDDDDNGNGALLPYFNASLIPSLPYEAGVDESIVKSVRAETVVSYARLQSAEVLTVLGEIPPADAFRPPYIGTSKPIYRTSNLRTDFLPSLAAVDDTPTLQSVVNKFSLCLRLDHHSVRPRWLRPQDAMASYQPGNTVDLNNAMLRLMLNDSIATKLPALIQFTQHAIDRAYAVVNGYRLVDDGHNPNHRVVAGWAAVMLDIQSIKDLLVTINNMHEDSYLSKPGSVAIWGDFNPANTDEERYWTHFVTRSGSQTQIDPYGYIDGGNLAFTSSDDGYQTLVAESWKAQALITRLMPELEDIWYPGTWTNMQEYTDRMVNTGLWATPDPAAPYPWEMYSENWEGYEVTWGPDPANPGSPIAGDGRFPATHGTRADEGQYKSAFLTAMWDAYRGS